ncbi:MAG: response regulator [Treponema sp.]|nr:response regulator [Treponema sp.]
MKNVLIVDAAPMFREFLKDKLSEEKIEVTVVHEKRDAIIKMNSLLPDLAIMDISEYDDIEYFLELLSDIKADPNASRVPLIATGPAASRDTLAAFIKYGIYKYFNKPIKFDVFFESIGHILHTPFSMDTTPCVLDIHRNGNIIFIEIAQSLNREKLSLLKYKLSEIIESHEIENPKIVLMMTNLELTFVDGLNLELLFDNILANSKILARNIKVLSFSAFTKELIDGHPQYDGIEMATEISQVLNSLVDSTTTSRVSDLVTDKLLTQSDSDAEGTIEMRFSSDTEKLTDESKAAISEIANQNTAQIPTDKRLRIAVIDDDIIIQKLLVATFTRAGYACDAYTTGTDFLAAIGKVTYSAVILDIMLPGISGFDTLKRLQGLSNKPPIIIYSQAVRKEMVVQALALGAKHYLVKPQKPETIVLKVKEFINAGN